MKSVIRWTFWFDEKYPETEWPISEGEEQEYVDAIIQEIREKGYHITGFAHQGDRFCTPVFDDDRRYRPEYMYITSNMFQYTNFEACIATIIPNFDIYGMGYTVSWKEWETIVQTAKNHGRYASAVVKELDEWLRRKSSEKDPAMSIMCI